LDTQQEVLAVLDETLSLRGRSTTFSAGTPLLGAIPEIDSMAVVSILTALEERFDFVVDDDEIDGSVFETVGSLVQFVEQKL
jgi:acyl carrier protein